MKIGSHIKNKNGNDRLVHVEGKPYLFAKTIDNHDVVHFVADVKNEDHAATLVSSGHFYPFDHKDEKKSTLTRTGEATPPVPTTSTALGNFTEEVRAEAEQLLRGSATDIGNDMRNIQSFDVVSAAVELEKQGQNRKTVLKLLESTIEYAKQSGAKV